MTHSSDRVSSFLQSQIKRGAFPGAQYVIGEAAQIAAEHAMGLAVVEPEHIPTTLDTIYDLASLTKPLVTSALIVKFAEQGLIDLEAPAARYLTELDVRGKQHITIKHLLTHVSGFPNWRPLYLEARDREDVVAAIARIATPLSPRLLYSDLNYVLLGILLERLTGERLDGLAAREIFAPLSLKRTMFNPPAELRREIAATECGQVFEHANADADLIAHEGVEVAASSSPGVPAAGAHRWRDGVIWGEVHDGNAYFMNGVAGHAGLFSTAREVFQIASQFLEGSKLFKHESLWLFRTNFTSGQDTARSLAWILAATSDCSAGPSLPPAGMGHNGFTGGSVWMEPEKRRVMILLTNRVHPRVDAIDMKAIRQRFNSLAIESLDGF
ncbi:MAG TPA: serine hydrolase domain-containing protein [Blastocatellia bacterium]|nr:serine hydrolase domain-containing protein [Blastocatellia bacterium]